MMLLSLDTERIQYENKFLINFGTVLFSHLTLPLRKGVHLEHGGDHSAIDQRIFKDMQSINKNTAIL